MLSNGPAHLTGRCNCGAVSFVAKGPFRPAVACHCKSCRRQSSHYLAATQIEESALTMTGGETLRWFAATDRAERGFCPSCGVHLFWRETGSGQISILMGSLDEPTGIALGRHIFVAEKGDYYDLDDDLPKASGG